MSAHKRGWHGEGDGRYWWPGEMPLTFSAWRTKKRREARAALKALDVLYTGSAFAPGQKDVTTAYYAIKKAIQQQKNWKSVP